MTKHLYLDDSYQQHCIARVLACSAAEEGGYDVELDQTVFYPESGGQLHDLGRIADAEITNVTEEGGRILHRTDKALQPGQTVTIEIDWGRRLDHMQQHTGEHLLSFAAKELYGAINVGFHMADAYCTIDLDMPLTKEQTKTLESRTNELICSNLPVQIQYVAESDLPALSLRKTAEGLVGQIRIVSMPGGDSCTCCGTHTHFTGEVGPLIISAAAHYKGGERITFVCGGRAIRHARNLQDITDEISGLFSCRTEDVPAALIKQQQELGAAKRDIKSLNSRLIAYLKQELLASQKTVKNTGLLVRLLDIDTSQLRPLAVSLCEDKPMLVLLLARSGDAAGGVCNYVLSCSNGIKLDMGDLSQAINAALSARGGGRGTLAQGSAKWSPATNEALQQLEGYLEKRLASISR